MKKIKYLLLAVFVSCAFILAGCGGDGQLGVKADANIGDVNAYAVATSAQQEDFIELINNEDVTTITGYRLTMEASGEDETSSMSSKINAIWTVVDGEVKLAIKYDMSFTDSANEENNFQESGKMWVVEEDIYMHLTEGMLAEMMEAYLDTTKVKMPLAYAEEEGMASSLEAFEMFSFSTMLEQAKDVDLSAEGITIKVNENETTKRFEITEMDGEEVSFKLYLVFENGDLTSCQLSTTIDEADALITISVFDGEIELPNLESFTDISAMGE